MEKGLLHDRTISGPVKAFCGCSNLYRQLEIHTPVLQTLLCKSLHMNSLSAHINITFMVAPFLFSFYDTGILHKGNGENIFISQQPPVISTVMGNGQVRSTSCASCNAPPLDNKLFAPVALACGADGSIYVGDFNFVRRILPNSYALSILELRYCLLYM